MAKRAKEEEFSDFAEFFSSKLTDLTKARAKERKPFNHAVHNYSTGLIPLDYAINPSNPRNPGREYHPVSRHRRLWKDNDSFKYYQKNP